MRIERRETPNTLLTLLAPLIAVTAALAFCARSRALPNTMKSETAASASASSTQERL